MLGHSDKVCFCTVMGCDECKELLKVMLDLIDDRNIHMYCELTSV